MAGGLKRPGWEQMVLLAVLLLALGLRFYRLDAQSFWNDEGNSARLSERTIPLIIEGTASDIHPPLYYLLLRGWRVLLGETEFGLRSFSAFVGVLTVAMAAALARQGRQGAGWLAALLTAVNPALIYYSQETRMYALLALWGALSTWLWWCWAYSKRSFTRRCWLAVVYVIVATAGLYTHYFFPAILLIHNLLAASFVLKTWHQAPNSIFRVVILPWATMITAVFLLYLPWLPIFLRQASGRPAVREPLGEFLGDSLNWLAFGETYAAAGWLVGLLVLLLLWAAVANWGSQRLQVLVLGSLFPILFMVVVGTTQPAFFKFMTTAVPFLCVWLASAAGFLPRRGQNSLFNLRMAIFLIGVLVLVVAGNGRSLHNLYFNPVYARADYRGLAQRIAAEAHPNAGIILSAPNQWEVFTYYHRQGAPVYPLPKNRADPATLDPQLAEIAATHSRLYAIFWGEEQRDPQRLVERWLDAHAFKTTDEWVGDVRLVVYALPGQAATTMQTAVDAQFGDFIRLRGHTLGNTSLAPGDILTVTLFWQTAVALGQRYKIFLHLLDANGQLVAQQDSEPGGGLNPTLGWVPQTTILDNHGILLPVTLSPGRYTLSVGLYDFTDPTVRLPLLGEATNRNALTLATISVR